MKYISLNRLCSGRTTHSERMNIFLQFNAYSTAKSKAIKFGSVVVENSFFNIFNIIDEWVIFCSCIYKNNIYVHLLGFNMSSKYGICYSAILLSSIFLSTFHLGICNPCFLLSEHLLIDAQWPLK